MLVVLLGYLITGMQLTPASASSPKERYEALLKEYPGGEKNFINAHRGEGRAAAKAFLAFAEECQDAPEAIESLGWVATHCLFRDEAGIAMDVLAQRHSAAPSLAPVIARIDLMYGGPFPPAERMLRSILRDSPHREVRGRAAIALAHELIARIDHYHNSMHMYNLMKSGKGGGAYYEEPKDTAEDIVLWADEAATLCERVLKQFEDSPAMRAEAEAALRTIRDISVGRRAPEIEGRDSEGKPLKLSEYRGKVVLLMFTSSDCPPCVAMYPMLRSLADRMKDEPFAMLSVYADPDLTTIRKKIEGREITWRCWWDGGVNGPIGERWNVQSYPTIFVLDATGMIRYKISGGGGMESAIDSLVKEAKSRR
jgi:thiol-disulfide isomerase/thioredoxin